eukprot:GHVU01180121.1.p4 GENE.GHVU01180121.1~~GHVU01180121.1.p4  ORF type:complete len:109 (+),score=4.14 GHVU01180121.1:77-403(+)
MGNDVAALLSIQRLRCFFLGRRNIIDSHTVQSHKHEHVRCNTRNDTHSRITEGDATRPCSQLFALPGGKRSLSVTRRPYRYRASASRSSWLQRQPRGNGRLRKAGKAA